MRPVNSFVYEIFHSQHLSWSIFCIVYLFTLGCSFIGEIKVTVLIPSRKPKEVHTVTVQLRKFDLRNTLMTSVTFRVVFKVATRCLGHVPIMQYF